MLAICQPGRGANAQPLTEQLNNLNDLFMFCPQPVQRLRFTKVFVASGAAITLHDTAFIPIRTRLFSLSITAMTRCHLTFLGQRLNVLLYLHDMQPLVFGLWLRPVGGDTSAGLDLVVC